MMGDKPENTTIRGGHDLPSAYAIVTLGDRRFYPLRFGRWMLDEGKRRISFEQLEDAEVFCRHDQRERERSK